MIIAVDFDGTCVTHEYPNIGKDIGAEPVLKSLIEKGHSLILFTMRSYGFLDDAVTWFEDRDIPLYGINENPTQKQWTISPKPYAHLYIDDASLGVPLISNKCVSDRPYLDWGKVKEILIEKRNIMKLIKPSYKILTSQSDLKDIELAGRTCYQSSEKISEDDSSAKVFVSTLVRRKHFAMLEFSKNITIAVDKKLLTDLLMVANHSFFKGFNITTSNTRNLLSMNPRTALEFMEYCNYNRVFYGEYNTIGKLYDTLQKKLPVELTSHLTTPAKRKDFSLYHILGQKELVSDIERIAHDTATVRFIIDRGVSHEFVRMRLCSFAQESTRYVDSKNAVFIEPLWFGNSNKFIKLVFKGFLKVSELVYNTLLNGGWQKQQARAVLPNALKTEIVVKATLKEWQHIFDLRCAKDAHPQFREVVVPLREEFKTIYPSVQWEKDM